MLHYALTASKPGQQARTCALFEAPTPGRAVDTGNMLVQSGNFAFVEPGSDFKVRNASRREVGLLQSFLAACNRADTTDFLATDHDGLLARRQSLLMSFFIGLYLKPASIKEWINHVAGTGSDQSPGDTGSGGVALTGPEVDAADGLSDPAENVQPPAEQGSPEAGQSGQDETESGGVSDESTDGVPGADDPVDSRDEMTAMLADITAGAEGAKDGPVDLGDDELF